AEMPFKFLQAKVDFSHTTKEGEDLEHFNQTQLMRFSLSLVFAPPFPMISFIIPFTMPNKGKFLIGVAATMSL
ncbi:unnamed protein product, partial [marine sediment metagenome]